MCGMGNYGGDAGEPPPERRLGSPRELVAAAYEGCADGLYRYALMILTDPATAEDAVHQAFAKLVGMGGRVRDIDSCDDYLRTAVRNECWRIIENRRRRPTHAEVSPETPLLEPVDRTSIDEDERIRIEDALRALPAEQREVVYLKIHEGKTFQEIADCVGASINTVASRYRHAIEKLRERLAGQYGTKDKANGL